MDGDDVGLPVQGVQIHVLGILADGVVLIDIVGDDTAAEAAEALDDGEADLAGAHDAHGHGAQLAPHLALQGEVVVVGVVERLLELADAHQDGHNGVLRHAVGRVSAVAQAEAQRAGVVAVHVVVAHAAAGQHLDAVALQLVQHLVAVVALPQRGHAVAAGGHAGGGLIQIGGSGDQVDAIFFAQVLDNGLFVGTYFISSDFHNILLSIFRWGGVPPQARRAPIFCFSSSRRGDHFRSPPRTAERFFAKTRRRDAGVLCVRQVSATKYWRKRSRRNQSFKAGSMGTASPAAIMAATCSSV